jgi:glutamate synthase (NADPH/NADH) small chain
MGRPRGFIEIKKQKGSARPVAERTRDFDEVELPADDALVSEQAARCMDCGVPFCHQGCPLGNLIPDWNDLVLAGRWDEASRALHATNNFPEITGRVCPAPCEASCVLELTPRLIDAPGAVTIKLVERTIADRAWAAGFVRPARIPARSGRRVAIVGSGPAGLAAAQELARRGHAVVIFEKADRIGGLLRYGIPDFKLDKGVLDRRIAQLTAEGVSFRTGVHVGVDVQGDALRAEFDAIVLAGGAIVPRDLSVAGRELAGVHFAMEFLTQQNRRVAGDVVAWDEAILATDRDVVILGGGDTGSDCVGTAHRQGARSVTSFELLPRPPDARAEENPWPAWPIVYRTSSSHEEGGERVFGVMTKRLSGAQGRLRALEAVKVRLEDKRLVEIEGSGFTVPCDLLLLAMGFTGSPREGLVAQLGLELDARGNVAHEGGATRVPGVYVAGDMARGQSLVVWAIAEGRKVGASVDRWLTRASLGEGRAAGAAPRAIQ